MVKGMAMGRWVRKTSCGVRYCGEPFCEGGSFVEDRRGEKLDFPSKCLQAPGADSIGVLQVPFRNGIFNLKLVPREMIPHDSDQGIHETSYRKHNLVLDRFGTQKNIENH